MVGRDTSKKEFFTFSQSFKNSTELSFTPAQIVYVVDFGLSRERQINLSKACKRNLGDFDYRRLFKKPV